MRCSFIFVILLFVFTGCKESSDTITSVTDDVNGLQYTFSAPKAIFGIHDTLSATVTVFNQSSLPETVSVSGFSFHWSLEYENGRPIMSGPKAFSWFIARSSLGSHQSAKIYDFREAIADTSGRPVPPGPYLLKASADALHFSLNLLLE
jgi:hypothetical protein